MNLVLYFLLGSMFFFNTELMFAASQSSDNDSFFALEVAASVDGATEAGSTVDDEESREESGQGCCSYRFSPPPQREEFDYTDPFLGGENLDERGGYCCGGGQKRRRSASGYASEHSSRVSSSDHECEEGAAEDNDGDDEASENESPLVSEEVLAYVATKAAAIVHSAYAKKSCDYVYEEGSVIVILPVRLEEGKTMKMHMWNHVNLFITRCFGWCSQLLSDEDLREEDVDGLIAPGPKIISQILNQVCKDAIYTAIAALPDVDEPVIEVAANELVTEPVIESVLPLA